MRPTVMSREPLLVRVKARGQPQETRVARVRERLKSRRISRRPRKKRHKKSEKT